MNKQEFIAALQAKLRGLPRKEAQERIDFYAEMIDDRIEDGLLEEEAVSQIGSVEEIEAMIIADIPLVKIAKEGIKPKKKLKAWEITLLALGSPIWFSLLVAAFAVILSLYAVLWSVVVSVWAAFASVVACVLGGVVGGILCAVGGYVPSGVALVGAGIACAGLAIFLFFGCKAATKGSAWLTAKIALGIKRCFIKKEDT